VFWRGIADHDGDRSHRLVPRYRRHQVGDDQRDVFRLRQIHPNRRGQREYRTPAEGEHHQRVRRWEAEYVGDAGDQFGQIA
jgi:hypothetical protein